MATYPVPVAYWFCPVCYEKRLYVLYDEPWDENMSQCSKCGHVFGYAVQAGVEQQSDGTFVAIAAPRPVLSPDVFRDGMLELRAEIMAKLSARHGEPVVHATHRLHQGLAETDRQLRAKLLNAQLPPRRST